MQGTPSAAQPAEANGLTLKKTVWTLSGQPADLANLHQNDRVMIVLEGQMETPYLHHMASLDLLPAGLEIEMPIAGDDAKAYPWLEKLSDVNLEDARDDRFVAAFDHRLDISATSPIRRSRSRRRRASASPISRARSRKAPS